MDSMDELRSPSLPTSPAASIIVFPSPSTLSSSSCSGQYGVQRNRGQLSLTSRLGRRCRRHPRLLNEGFEIVAAVVDPSGDAVVCRAAPLRPPLGQAALRDAEHLGGFLGGDVAP